MFFIQDQASSIQDQSHNTTAEALELRNSHPKIFFLVVFMVVIDNVDLFLILVLV